MMYGAQTLALKKAQGNKLEVAEMRMLRLMELDRIRNNTIILNKVHERWLKLCGHGMLREL